MKKPTRLQIKYARAYAQGMLSLEHSNVSDQRAFKSAARDWGISDYKTFTVWARSQMRTFRSPAAR